MRDQELTPLRVVLQNFLNHIETLESKTSENSYESEFQHLKNFSESVKGLKQYSCSEGEKEVNRKKNRYKDILPFDVSRVVLNEYGGILGSDYINANFIKGASGSPAYIACQGPLPNTVNDFWRMVVQCEVQVIVMACNEEEAGKTKCEKYWVDDAEEKNFGGVGVKLLKSSTVCTDFSVRTMRLKYKNSQSAIEERTVCQLHYVAWPDHGVPSVVQPLLDMVRLVRDTQASETLPVLVHCSAGCGRTGTICAIDYVWGLLRTGKLTKDFSLLGLIREMRRQRIAMVQTKEQYVLVHHAVRELFKEQLHMIDSHPYENIDLNGMLKECVSLSASQDSDSSMSGEDSSETHREDLIVPPLPERPRSFFTSKQEKEVENLNAQQKLLHPMKNKNMSYHHTKMSQDVKTIEKLIDVKAEYPYRDNTSLKSLSKGDILSTFHPSPGVISNPSLSKMNVKRSKSLKALPYGKEKFSLCPVNGASKERRPSLESNYEELFLSLSVSEPVKKISLSSAPPNLFSKNNVPVNGSASRSDKLSVRDYKKPLVRSHTTLEISHRPYMYVNDDAEIRLNESHNKKPINYKLVRSRTHINLERPSEAAQPKPSNVSKCARHSVDKSRVVGAVCEKTLRSDNYGRMNVKNTPDAFPQKKPPEKISHRQKLAYLKPHLAKDSNNSNDVNHFRPFNHDIPQDVAATPSSSESVISVHPVLYSSMKLSSKNKLSSSHEKYHKSIGPPPLLMSEGKSVKVSMPVNGGVLKSTHSGKPSSGEFTDRVPSHYLSSPLSKHVDKHSYGKHDRKNIAESSKLHKPPMHIPTSHLPSVMLENYSEKEHSRLTFPTGKAEPIENKRFFLRGFRPRRKLPNEEKMSDTDSSLETKNVSLPAHFMEKKEPSGHQIENSPSVRSFYEDKIRKGKRMVSQKNCMLPTSGGPYPTVMDGSRNSTFAGPPCSSLLSSSLYPYSLQPKQSSESPYCPTNLYEEVHEAKQYIPTDRDPSLGAGLEHLKWQYPVHRSQNDFECAPGIDLDKVAASITEKDGSKKKFMKAALDSLHLRKSRESIEKNGLPTQSFADSPSSQPSSSSGSKKKSHHQYI